MGSLREPPCRDEDGCRYAAMKMIVAGAGQARTIFTKHHLLSIVATALALGLANLPLRVLLTWLDWPTTSAA